MRSVAAPSVVRIVIGVVLIASATAKLTDMGVFQAVVALSGFVPGPAVPAVAWVVTLGESAIGLLFLLGGMLQPRVRERSLWAAAFLVTAFVTYGLSRLILGIALPGPYFGIWSLLSPAAEAVLALMALASLVWLLAGEHRSDPLDDGSPSAPRTA